ncbi:hypothetical protein TIFTF001_033072 [Ficus carica]|uniref:Uncharacterized protein n=1 Tax=Ficus carica TaxID=3494 RepID=A0AA88J8Q7_FICCA|nr:hypothetical protein TIFTF001_033072 [Ficus carica]
MLHPPNFSLKTPSAQFLSLRFLPPCPSPPFFPLSLATHAHVALPPFFPLSLAANAAYAVRTPPALCLPPVPMLDKPIVELRIFRPKWPKSVPYIFSDC